MPGEGPAIAPFMFVGEAPGAQEDATGRPFCGRSGRFFDDLLDHAGLDRGAVFVTSSVKCRPPGNRDPRVDELRLCREAWLERQVACVGPRLIVLMGTVPVRQMLGRTTPLKSLRGTPVRRAGRMFLPTYHPAAGMRFPAIAAALREDFCRLRIHAETGR